MSLPGLLRCAANYKRDIVIPAKAGIQFFDGVESWIPGSALRAAPE